MSTEKKRTRKPLHLGIGHFWVGARDGVNVVMMRNVETLLELHPEIRITLFGKLSAGYEKFLKPVPGKLEYMNIEYLDPNYEVPGLPRKAVSEQSIQDYIWHGTNILETLAAKLRPMDIVLTENLGIGIHPAATYAFYLYLQYCQHHHPRKRIFYRAHDFLQQRAKNFENLKKFQDTEIPLIPNWHEVVYPNYPNLGYITINTSDIGRLIEHGIDRARIAYVPNSIDNSSLVVRDEEHKTLRGKLIEQMNLDTHVKFVLYPVRCVKRKNVEEAIFLTCLFNALSENKIKVRGAAPQGKYHLLVGIRPESGEDLAYAETIDKFCRKHKLPATIGIQDLVSIEREIDPKTMQITKFDIGDAYHMSDIVVTTSYLEGFGFAFIEPWCLGKAVIGRNIPGITQDFQRAGLNLDHLYDVFRINGQDYLTLGYQDKEHMGLEKRLHEILKLQDRQYVAKLVENNEQYLDAIIPFLNSGTKESILQKNSVLYLQLLAETSR